MTLILNITKEMDSAMIYLFLLLVMYMFLTLKC